MLAPRPTRFLPLDGMRAIAALAVALYHFQQRIPHLDARLPRFLSIALQHGNVGVHVFFVLSGFAVARSLAHEEVDLPTVGRFMLRRAVRLDPPYVLTMLLVVFLALRNPGAWPIAPTLPLVVAHVFYLQGVLGMLHLQGVFWTLCIELQLYLAFALACTLCARAGENRRFAAALVVSAVAAAALTWAPPSTSTHLLPYWPLFCLGVLVERAQRVASHRALLVAVAALLALDLAHPQLEATMGLATASVLWLASKAGPVARALGSRWLRAAGARSYSFYLLHALVGGVVFDATARVASSAWFDVGRMALALAASVAAALALHRFVEAPAQELSRRLGARVTSRSAGAGDGSSTCAASPAPSPRSGECARA